MRCNTMSLQVEVSDFLGTFDQSDANLVQIEKLEDYIQQANRAADEVNRKGAGQYLIEDEVYDQLVSLLKQVNPDSPLLQTMWEGSEDSSDSDAQLDALDEHLSDNPMKSITTIKTLEDPDYLNYINAVPEEQTEYIAEAKLNGHGIRLVYNNGVFIKATSRARNSQGHDLTEQLKVVLGLQDMLEVPEWSQTGIVEVRGELLVSFDDFEVAKEYVPNLVSPLFAVGSMSRDSASEEEWSLLNFIAYRCYIDGVAFDTRTDLFEYLQNLGFNIPIYTTFNITREQMQDNYAEHVVNTMEELIFDEEQPYDYYTDGVVLEINNTDEFKALGASYKYDLGNIALKIGSWQQSGYSGIIQMIRWTQGKSKLSPVAIIAEEPDAIEFEYDGETYKGYEELADNVDINEVGDVFNLVTNYSELGIATMNGAKVKRIPLYEPANMFILNANIGSCLHFKYGGEAGVVPTDEAGRTLTNMNIALFGE